jgi:hypothetical protein
MSSARIAPFAAVAIALAVAGIQFAVAADGKSSPIKAIMKDGFKGEEALFARVVAGNGSADDKAKLLTYAKELTKLEPPKGDAKSWQAKTAALVKAAEGATANTTGANPALKTAGDCKGCHSVHKPAPQRPAK